MEIDFNWNFLHSAHFVRLISFIVKLFATHRVYELRAEMQRFVSVLNYLTTWKMEISDSVLYMGGKKEIGHWSVS